MGLFGSIIKLGLDIVETPIAIVKDVATIGENDYTKNKLEDISDDYDEFKNKIQVEHFSGYSEHSILQDFYAALFVSNVQSLIVGEINDELAGESNGNKYQYKVITYF